MRIEVKVAFIGAAAAILAALIPLVWNWPDGPADDVPAEVTMIAAPEASAYQGYALKEAPPAFAQAEIRAEIGYYLWPQADLSELLPILSLGAEMAPQQYPTFADIEEPGNATRNDHMKQLWSVIELVGQAAKAHPGDIPNDLIGPARQPLLDPLGSDGLVGLQLLRAVYLGDEGRVAGADNPIVKSALSYTRGLFDATAVPAENGEKRLWLAAKFLAQRRVFPVLDLSITNPNDDPMVITGLVVDVLATAPAMSGLETGSLDILDVVKVKLDPAGGRHPVTLTDPLRIVSKDTARLRLELSSDVLFGFLARIDVVRGADVLGSGTPIIVDIGFRPPAGSEPI